MSDLPERVLLVCTGNTCRSPMAMVLLRALVAETAPHVEVTSAGVMAEGYPATQDALAVMGKRGLDLSAHRSTAVGTALGVKPDLIVGMAREHVRSVVDTNADLFGRTFTLKEIVRRVETEGSRKADEPLIDYLERVGAGRRQTEHLGWNQSDDIADPIGQGPAAYQACAAEIEDLVGRMVGRLWPDGPTGTDIQPSGLPSRTQAPQVDGHRDLPSS